MKLFTPLDTEQKFQSGQKFPCFSASKNDSLVGKQQVDRSKIYRYLFSHLKVTKLLAAILLCAGSIGTTQLIATPAAQAEGSKELTANTTGYRPWFVSPVGGSVYQGVRQQLVANVYVESGETINVGSSGIALNGATIILKAPNGTTYTATGSGGVGVINNRTQEVAGPLPNSTGYSPYSRTVATNEIGVWQVTFISPGTGVSSMINTTNWTRAANQGTSSALIAWDVTVRNSGGTSIPGRTYITNIGASMGDYYPSALKADLYVLTKPGYIYQVNTSNLSPFAFNFFSNNKGFTSGGNPTYQSLNGIPTVGTNVFDPNAVDSGTDINNKMFLNNPLTAGLPVSASHPASVSTWLVDTPVTPVVNNYTYTPNSSGVGGTFTFTASVVGSYSIELDTNNNGSYADATDRIIQGLALSGSNSYVWNGKDGAGNLVNSGATFNTRISTRSGEIHFPITDAESNPSGFVITRLNGVGAGDSTLYWDDTSIVKTGVTSTKNLIGATSSPTGAHSWGSTGGSQASEFGNDVGIDTWTFVRSAFIFTQVVPASASGAIAGTVFEDPNYGGGAGRNLATVGTSPRDGATVELYKSDGTYVSSTTTSSGGKYSFSSLSAGDYKIRVVNSTVSSSRTGYVSTLVPVQTFLTSAGVTAGTVSEVIDRVGGEIPSEVDAPAHSGTQTLADLNTLTGQEVQSVTAVKVGSASITGIDFGYNFDTIVNTNNAGQGSLRQFILNSNALSNTGLNQVPNPSPALGTTAIDPTTGEEASIFMIADSTAHAGLRAGLPNLLTGGVAAIAPSTSLPVITDAGTSIDGRTQTANVGNTKTGVVGYIGTVGTPATTSLSGVPNPEIQISNNHTQSQGLNVTGNSFAARGISIYGFGSTGLDNNANIFLNGSSNSVIETSVIGTASGAALNTAPASGNGTRHGIAISSSATNITIQDNLIAENGVSGVFLDEAGSNTYSNITIRRNEAAFNGMTDPTSGDGFTLYNCTSGCVIQNNYIHNNQAYGIQDYQNQGLNITANTINSNGSGGTETAGIMVWGSIGTQIFQNIVSQNTGDGVYLARHPSVAIQPLAKQVKISQNSFFGNGQLGIDLAGPSANPAVGYRTGQAPYVTANDGITGNTVSNNGIDYPVITYSTLTAGSLTVKGFVGNVLASTTFSGAQLEFFIADNSPANQNGEVILNDGKSKPHGEGRTYLGTCVTDSNSQFNCSFATAGALGLTDATNITATATDSSGNTSEFSAIPTNQAKLILVKRITAITDGVSSVTTSFSSFVDDAGTTDDNLSGWSGASYLLGAINGGTVKPGDEIEYTLYYLNSGENRIAQARVCDRLNADLIFQPQFSTSTSTDQGVEVAKGLSIKYPTNTDTDNDGGLFSTSSTMPIGCNLVANSTANLSNNIVVVDVATSSNPLLGNERGYVRFKVKVRQ